MDVRYEEYAQTIFPELKRYVFYETAYMVLKGGDVVKLITGPNNSGKTWTDLPQGKWVCNFLRDFWSHQDGEEIIEGFQHWDNTKLWKLEGKEMAYIKPDIMEGLKKVQPFSMRRDVMFYPSPDLVKDKISTGSMFNIVCATEGMKAAINLRSWDPKVIDMILETYTERSSHNYLAFEYQLASRPPKMLGSRFTCWQQKMGQKWLVLSIPSSLYRTDDPLFTKEIEKIKGDKAIGNWFTSKKDNANYIGTFKSPRMSLHADTLFKNLRKEAKEIYEKTQKVKKTMSDAWAAKIDEYYSLEHEGQIAYVDIPTMLMEQHQFNKDDVKKFMKDYDKYARGMKLMKQEILNKD